jgi:hypothetical protein
LHVSLFPGALSPLTYWCKTYKITGPKHTHFQREHNYLVSLPPTQPGTHRRHDRILQRHPHRVRNVPSSWTNAIDTADTLHARHSHQSLGRWHFQSNMHNSCGLLGQWQQWWQPIDLTTPFFLSFSFSVILLLWSNKLDMVSNDFNQW